MPLAQRTVLITGAGRGLGKGIALSLAAEQMRIALCYRGNRAAAERTAREIQKHGAEALVLQADVTVPSQVHRLVASTVKHFGRLDVLVNNVGEFSWKPVAESTPSGSPARSSVPRKPCSGLNSAVTRAPRARSTSTSRRPWRSMPV